MEIQSRGNAWLNGQAATAEGMLGFAPGLGLAGGHPVLAKARAGRAVRRPRKDRGLPERLVALTLLGDALVILYTLVAAFWLRFRSELRHFGVSESFAFSDYAGYLALGTASLVAVLASFHVYEKQSLLRFRYVAQQAVKACLIWGAGFLSFALMFKMTPPVSRLFVVLAVAHALVGLLAWRAAFRWVVRRSAVATQLRQRILCVGWNPAAARLASHFAEEECAAYEFIGCVVPPHGRIYQEPPAGVPVLGQFGDLSELLHTHAADIVMLTDVDCVKGEIVGLVNLCEKEMVHFQLIPSYFQILVSGLHLETVSGIPMLGVSRLPLDNFLNVLLKRIVDVIGASVGLVLSAPLLLVCGILIRRESPGNAFFSQERMGRRGRTFRMWKLRSMRPDAEKTDHLAQSTVDGDPRVLRVGKWMRRWNVDEVPQFWNVLCGDMSLVGPRPERIFHSEQLSEEIPHYNARYNAKPGMTGWAQVKGLRGDTDLTERIQCDLWYLENWSLLRDTQIMALTFWGNKGAC